MFDALEHKFKNTEQSDLISRLYEGKMTDYVRCLKCRTEKARDDTFLGMLVNLTTLQYLLYQLSWLLNFRYTLACKAVRFADRIPISGRSTESFCRSRNTRWKQSVLVRQMQRQV